MEVQLLDFKFKCFILSPTCLTERTVLCSVRGIFEMLLCILFVGLVFKRAQFVFSTALFEPTSLCVFGFYKTWYYLFFCISFGVLDMVCDVFMFMSLISGDSRGKRHVHTPEIKPEIHFSTFFRTIMKTRCLNWETDQSENVDLLISFVLFSFLWNLYSWGNSNKSDVTVVMWSTNRLSTRGSGQTLWTSRLQHQSKPGWTISTRTGYY